MKSVYIRGNASLYGEVTIQGSKNAALPIMAAALLVPGVCVLRNCPRIADVEYMCRILACIGCRVDRKGREIRIDASELADSRLPKEYVTRMRSSVMLMGPLLGRLGEVSLSHPGGCVIGDRPIDLHVKALSRLGADCQDDGTGLTAVSCGLRGTSLKLDYPSVGATENVIMAAALAKGKTRIINAAKEPEVVQLCEVLAQNGIEIEGIGSNEISIYGSDGELPRFSPFSVIPDRIEAGTYLCAGAITNSRISLHNANSTHLQAILEKLEEIGFGFEITESSITILPAKKRNAFELITTEYPGFPTDMQAQFMALATQCEGVSVIEERLFENRFMHVSELQRLGADIKLSGNIAKISGAKPLMGANVMATDLRASSALVLAALIAKDTTQIHRIYHLDRGYENLESKLKSLGVTISRDKE